MVSLVVTSSPPATITICPPSRYASTTTTTATTTTTTNDRSNARSTPPPLSWLHRTWTVTHSTLSMWRAARNVRITYTPSPPRGARARLGDLVEYEAADGRGGVRSVRGVDTAAAAGGTGVWYWRGSGWLCFVGSRWEVLGWGERPVAGGGPGEVERWVVTWFAPTVFTREGVDVYSDRREGGSPELVGEILGALRGIDARPLAKLCQEMQRVQMNLPWK